MIPLASSVMLSPPLWQIGRDRTEEALTEAREFDWPAGSPVRRQLRKALQHG